MKPEDWVKLLFTYGPFALLVFFMVYGEARARSALSDDKVSKKVSIPIYVANWAVIFVLMSFALSAWYRLTFNTEFTLRGTLQNLQGGEMITSNDHTLFLSRRYGPNGHFDYSLRIITPKQLKEGDKVPFQLDLSTPGTEKLQSYNLPVHASLYGGPFTLSYDREQSKLVLDDGTHKEELQPGAAMVVEKEPAPSSLGSLFVWSVKAQMQQQEQRAVPLKERLEAPDAIIRMQARQELAQRTGDQWAFIDGSLANPTSSYRVKLGVISALSSDKCSALSRLSQPSLLTVVQSTADSDPTLRGLARGCVLAQASPAVDSAFDSAVQAAAANKRNVGELAKTQMEVLYALGIAAKDRYGSRQAQDQDEFPRAIKYFQKSWGLRQLAAVPDKVLFAKALYGWGLALHDRSWIQRGPNKTRRPEYVRAAQNKFAEFLSAVRTSGNPGAYPYPAHLKSAEAYLHSPEPSSLQTK